MPAFFRVDAQRAGPAALGILVPPGAQTLVILRPRAQEWDLLPARWTGEASSPPTWCQFSRDEAAGVARRVQQALEDSVQNGNTPVAIIGDSAGQRFQVWLRAGEFVWVVCRRVPGQAYQPLIFASAEEAQSVGRRLEPIFWPRPDANQEYYFNTQNFGK